LSNVLRPVFGSWLGSLVPPDRPIVFVLDDATDRDELLRQCANIGYDAIAGELAGGADAWVASGRGLATIPVLPAEELDGPVLDVRQTPEFQSGHVPGARHVELSAFGDVPDLEGPVAVMCGHGERAASAASLLAAHGCADVRIVTGGPADWAAAPGRTLESETPP
jgi:rhodanese-related sulfurtransferase